MSKIFVSGLSLLLINLFACHPGKTPAGSRIAPPAPVYPIPSAEQLAWHEMEMNAFVHFSINTFTDKEWGYGDESPALFNPTAFDATQWTRIFAKTGFKCVILTCKHHDGFSLWPSAATSHSVKNSPYKNGKGDIVREVRDACMKEGLKFGTYLSPWDRNHTAYGAKAYIDYYRAQLHELFTGYGPVFEMWFDGANGGDGYYGGARETRKIDGKNYYDWPTTLSTVRKLEPGVIFFSDAGPGVRWVGNERGIAGETNWNTITPDTLYAGKAGIEGLLNTGSPDGTAWIPAETDVSIRPGWFYHSSEDASVKTPEQLFEIYLTSVGRGSTLLLNVPPDKRGLIHEADQRSLEGFRALLDKEFNTNLAATSLITASNSRGNDPLYSVTRLTDNNNLTYWATDDDVHEATLEINLRHESIARYLVLQEQIRLGQRIKSFVVESWEDETWKEIASGTTVGYKRILRLGNTKTKKIRVRITAAKASPTLSNLAVF